MHHAISLGHTMGQRIMNVRYKEIMVGVQPGLNTNLVPGDTVTTIVHLLQVSYLALSKMIII